MTTVLKITKYLYTSSPSLTSVEITYNGIVYSASISNKTKIIYLNYDSNDCGFTVYLVDCDDNAVPFQNSGNNLTIDSYQFQVNNGLKCKELFLSVALNMVAIQSKVIRPCKVLTICFNIPEFFVAETGGCNTLCVVQGSGSGSGSGGCSSGCGLLGNVMGGLCGCGSVSCGGCGSGNSGSGNTGCGSTTNCSSGCGNNNNTLCYAAAAVAVCFLIL